MHLVESARHRTCSIEFKRLVAQDFLGAESLNGLARRHDVSRNLIRVRVACCRHDYRVRFLTDGDRCRRQASARNQASRAPREVPRQRNSS